MDAAAIIALISQVVKVAVDLTPVIIKTTQDAEPFAKVIWEHLVNKKVITEADMAALEAQIAVLSAQLQNPLPPPDDQDV